MASLFGNKEPEIGQDIGKFRAGAGDYGMSIPYVFGCMYVPEFRLWQQETPSARQQDQGGKGVGGGKGGSQTLYSGSFVSGFCMGPIPKFSNRVAIRRIFGDSSILADFSERKTWLPTPETTQQENDRLDSSRKFMERVSAYEGKLSGQISDPGTTTQKPTTVAQFKAGAALNQTATVIPGYQGIVYCSFDNLDWPGGRPPGITIEVCQKAIVTGIDQLIRQPVSASEVFTKLLVDSGISESDIDVSGLDGSELIRGIIVPQDGKIEAINNIMRFFNLECYQTGGIIHFVKIDRPVVVRIPFSDLRTVEKDDGKDQEPLTIKDIRKNELPKTIQITAKNYDNDYVKLTETYSDPSEDGEAVVQYDMGDFSATSTDLRQSCEIQLYRQIVESYTYDEFYLPSYYNNLDPCDVIEVVDSDNTINTIRLKTVDIGGSNGIVKCSGVRHGTYTSQLQGSPATGGAGVISSGSTTWYFMNLPPLNDSQTVDPGACIAATGTSKGWAGAYIFQSKDAGANYFKAGNVTAPATIGNCNSVLGSGLPYKIDTLSTLTVTMVNGQLLNVDRAQLLQGANLAYLSNGEIIQFEFATLIGTNQYQLSNIVRGRRGTERFISTHASGEYFILLTDINGNVHPGISFLTCGLADINRVDSWKVVPTNANIADQTAYNYAITANNLVPFSPVNFRSSVDLTSGSPDVTWTVNRRSRLGQVLTPNTNLPIGESAEKYHWIIRNGTTAIHDEYTTIPTYTYTHTQRNADLGSPTFNMTGYTISCAQLSEAVGEGTPAIYTFTGAYA